MVFYFLLATRSGKVVEVINVHRGIFPLEYYVLFQCNLFNESVSNSEGTGLASKGLMFADSQPARMCRGSGLTGSTTPALAWRNSGKPRNIPGRYSKLSFHEWELETLCCGINLTEREANHEAPPHAEMNNVSSLRVAVQFYFYLIWESRARNYSASQVSTQMKLRAIFKLQTHSLFVKRLQISTR